MHKEFAIVDGWTVLMEFDTKRGAKIALTRKYKAKYPEAVVMSQEELKAHKENEPMREVTNLMTGKKVLEKVSTPYYLSVSSETYWSR